VPDFRIGETDFELDGQPFRVLAGALHYFRVHPEQWADRIHKAKLMGLNTIETYVPWNLHEPNPGHFELTGRLDLERFLQLIADAGMYAIVRPGPYICAEWDNGGLPAWLFRDEAVGVRRFEPLYMAEVERYFDRVLPIVERAQISNGGPVILVQIENEYGAYGDDKQYLEALVALNRAHGITVPLTTIDQPTDEMLANGSLPGLHKTGSFGSRATERLATLRRHQPSGPLMCAEFWNGWFDFWGSHHHTTPAAEAARELDELLASGASVNLYMFHGGTNFGFTNGANDKGVYQPTVTSYDYDAPLDEAGNPGPKFWAFRDVIAKYAPVPDEVPDAASPAPAFRAPVDAVVPFWQVASALGESVPHRSIPTFDQVEHYTGFGVYCTEIDFRGTGRAPVLTIGEVRDRALVYLNRQPVGVLSRDNHDRAIGLPFEASGTLEILVEDQGRVNYGHRIGEDKGLIGPVTIDGHAHERWELQPLGLDDLSPVSEAFARAAAPDPDASAIAGPAFVRATVELDAPTDLFLDTTTLGKGVAWVNGFNLGRYWRRGPQNTLYVPASTLKPGANEIVLFELHAIPDATLTFVSAADLGHTEF